MTIIRSERRLATHRQPKDRTSRLLQNQRQVYIEAPTRDRLRQVVACIHVPEDRIRAGSVWAGRAPRPVAGGGFLRGLVVEEGRGAIADDATARHVGRSGDGLAVVHSPTVVMPARLRMPPSYSVLPLRLVTPLKETVLVQQLPLDIS